MYAVVSPHDGLTFRPKPVTGMWRDVSADRGACTAFDVQRATHGSDGMMGVVTAHPGRDAFSVQPNPIAGPLVAALGGPEGDWFGDLALCGSTAVPGSRAVPCDLSPAQQRVVSDVYHAVRAGLRSVTPAGD